MARFHKLVDKSENTFAKWAGTWDVEIFAVVFSCLTLIAMIIMLAEGNDKIVWSGVTLNTYVSILATASKLSALFALSSAIGQTKWNTFRRQSGSLLEFEAIDLASRGALGCVQLLFQTRKVALVGALTFILAFSFDPFTQQLVQLKADMSFKDSAGVAAPISMRYSGGSQLHHPMMVVNSSSMETLLDPHVDIAMQTSILSGLVQDETIVTRQLLVSCPSGNCTWSPTQSLAVCSRCDNIGSMVKKSSSKGNPLNLMIGEGDAPMAITKNTRYSLSNGLYIENPDGWTQLRMTALGTGRPEDTVQMKDVDTLIFSMTMLKALPNPRNASAVWPDLSIQATECALYYCVREYDLAVEGNEIKQNSSELVDMKRQPDSWQPYAPSSNRSASSVASTSISWDMTDSTNYTDLSLGDEKHNFNVSFDAVRSISQYFWTNFYTNITEFPHVTGFYIDSSEGEDFRPSVMQLLYGEDDIPKRFETLAHSMTNAVRMHQAGKQDFHGKLGRSVTKYRIEWPWITMPILIVLATIVQLILTIRNSRTRPILKSSILAVLSRGPYLNGVFDGAETVKDLRDAAAQENVCLFDMAEPMISPRHAKKFSISSSYMTASSPAMTVDGLRSSSLAQDTPSHWNADGFSVTQTSTGRSNHGLGISSDDGSPLLSPRRALLSSWHERSMSSGVEDTQDSPLLREMQKDCPHFRGVERVSR